MAIHVRMVPLTFSGRGAGGLMILDAQKTSGMKEEISS